MVSIFEYTDYQAFLRDRLKEMRQSSTVLSYRYAGQKLKMDASQILKIVQGRLHLAEKRILDFARFLKLDERETEFFRLLVLFNKARRAEEARNLFEQMVSLTGISSLQLKRDQYLFFSEWYHTAILCALEGFDCKRNYRELGAHLRPSIQALEAKESIQLLERLGMVARNAQGFWKSTNQNFTTGKQWQSAAIQQFQHTAIQMGAEAIERFDKQERDISTLTLSMSPSLLEEVRLLAEDFRRTVARLCNQSENTNQVYQLNVQLFPLTHSTSQTKGTL